MCYKVHNKQLGITITKMVILLMLGGFLQSPPPISAQYLPPPVPRIEISPKYVVLHRNGVLTPQEERVVVITLTGFQQSNVELQIKRGVTIAEPHIKTVSELAVDQTETVEIDSITGVGTITLTIDETWSQDIYWLWAAGLTDPTPWGNPDTMPLIVEDQRQIAFPSFQATIHYCPSFFKALHAENNGAIFAGDDGWADYETMAEKYVDYVEEAVVSNYNAQIVTWGFASPYDENDDGQLHIAIGDGEDNVLHAFHTPLDRFFFGDAAWVITEINNFEGESESELGIHYPANWPREQRDEQALEYPSTQAAVKSVMAHEFFHAVQENYTQGFKSWDWIGQDWWWVTEGQARFLQSAQYETEEFVSRNSGYLKQAYFYLQNDLRAHIIGGGFNRNTSRETGYTYAPFWRTVYEVYDIAAIRNTLEWIGARPKVYNCQKCPPQDELTYMSEVVASAIAPPNEIFPLFAARNYALRFTKEGETGDRDVIIRLYGDSAAQVPPQYVYQYANLYLDNPDALPISPITCNVEEGQLQLSLHGASPIIPANYGMEFWELEFANDACRYSAFQINPGNDNDAFSVQVWPIHRDENGITLPLTDAPQSLGIFSDDAAAILPATLVEDIDQATHLAILVTRVDIDLDAEGEYTISRLQPPGQCDGSDDIECARQWIIATLGNHDILVTDPPVPGMLFASTLYPRPSGGAQAVLTTTTSPAGSPPAGSFTTSHTVASGDLQATWTADSWVAAQFATLSVPYAQVYDEQDTLLAEGAVLATAQTEQAVALALGGTLSYTVAGHGTVSFYAPATSGLGAAGMWQTYSASIAADSTFGVGLQGATLTAGGRTFSGTLVLVLSDTLTLSGSGHTLAPNFAASVAISAEDAFVRLAPGNTYQGYSGTLTISEQSAALDSVTLAGTYTRALDVAASPAQSQITPFETATFQATLSAVQGTAPDVLTATVTIAPPPGWSATLDAAGQVTLTPARNAAPGDYGVDVIAQANDDLALLARTVHTVTLLAHDSMQLAVAPDPMTTVPWGPVTHPGGGINTGQAQIPGAAYLATISNTSTSAHPFRVEITPDNFAADWIALGGAGRATTTTLTLAAGGAGRLGIYVTPQGLETLPPAGTQYTFSVRAVATDAPALDQSVPEVFTMPEVPFNLLAAEPASLLATDGVPATLDVSLTNVGNVSATFEVLALAPNDWAAGAPYSISLETDATVVLPYTFVPTGTIPGDTDIIRVQSPAPGSPYVQEDTVNVTIVGPCTFAAAQAASLAAAMDDTALRVALEDLVTQLRRWEQDETNAGLLARTRAAAELLQAQIARYPQIDDSAIAALTTATGVADFCTPLSDLGDDLSSIAQRNVSARFVPGYDAALPDTPVTYTLHLQNHGTLTTTYRTNLQISRSANGQIDNQQIVSPGTTWLTVIAPGQVVTSPVVLLPEDLGAWTLEAQVEAIEDSLIRVQTTAGLKVADAFIQVTDVTADPLFVEAGDNSTDLYISVANIVNINRSGQAHVSITAPEGAEVFSDTVPMTIPGGLHWSSHALGSVSVDGWSKDTYTITVNIADQLGRPIPDGSGSGSFVVGEGVSVAVATQPEQVAPGDTDVTTVITTERTAAVGSVPVEGMENVYTFYLPEDNYKNDDHYDGFYVVGLRPTTQYQVQRFDEAGDSWVAVVTETVTMDDINFHFDGYLFDNVYRVYADNPVLIVVTSGEGSLVSGVTPDLKFRGRHFTFLGDYEEVLGWSRAVIFAMEDDTTVNIETRSPEGTWSTPVTNTLQTSTYWFYQEDTTGTVLMRVTADKDLIVYRASKDDDELDTVIADNGTPYGTTFYFAPVVAPNNFNFSNVFILYNTESDDATVTIYNINTPSSPAVAWQGTVPAMGAVSAVPSGGTYYRIESDRTLNVLGGARAYTQLIPGGNTEDAIWELLETRMGNYYLYQTNLLYSQGMELVEEYTEFETGLRGQTEIQTEIPLVNKNSDFLWGNNSFNYLSSEPVTLTLEVVTPTILPGLYRREENHGFEYTPSTWQRASSGQASRGYYAKSYTAGQVSSLAFEGDWVGVGFLTTNVGGQAEVFIDGTSYGVVDTYSRYQSTKSMYYDISDGGHTISVTVLGTRHPNSSGNWIYLDYVDTWNGDPPTGLFEENGTRVIASSNCKQVAFTGASGGSYCLGADANAWFGFAGDSVTYQAMANTANEEVEVLVDGELLTQVNLKSSAVQTQTYTFDDLGSGPHVLQIRAYRGKQIRVDAFITPGAGSAYTPPERSGVVRYEEDDAVLRYDGVPYEQRPTQWEYRNLVGASDGFYELGTASNHTVSLTFTGTWVGLGYVAAKNGTEVEIWIDGVYVETIDTYHAYTLRPESIYYDGLTSGEHTIAVRTLGDRFYFDYFDVWDGTQIPVGTSETPFASTWDWTNGTSAVASGGQYYYDGTAMWYAFTGESVTYQALSNTTDGEVEVLVDGELFARENLRSSTVQTQTYSFENLANGPHVLQVRAYRSDQARVDAFITPGIAPFYTPPEQSGIVRHEEDDATLRYDGMSYEHRSNGWEYRKFDQVSDGYCELATASNLTVSLTFTGTWVGLGYVARTDGTEVEVWIDGVYTGTVDTYASSSKPESVYYGGLTPGEHTIAVRTLGNRFYFDYFDAWDGTQIPAAWSETPFAATWGWNSIEDAAASGGQYYRAGAAMWYAFTGESVTYQALAYSGDNQAEVSIDGITQSIVSLYNATPITRTFNYTGLDSGAHMLQVRAYSGQASVDAFASPSGTLALAPTSGPAFALAAPELPSRALTTSTRKLARNAGPEPFDLPMPDKDEDASTPSAPSGTGRVPGVASLITSAPVNELSASGEPIYELQLVDTETYLTLDGVSLQTITEPGVYTVVLPAGHHVLTIKDYSNNITLTGVTMEPNAALVWNLDTVSEEAEEGVYSSKFWRFISNEPLQIRQGGSGNCWIHTMFPYNYGESYTINLTHTVPLTDVEVISSTFSTAPLTVTQSGQATAYAWTYELIPSESVYTLSFDLNLEGMQPGETRQVSTGTDVHYATLGGQGRLFIGPRYVSAAHIVALDPYSRTTAPGNNVSYTLTLSNPTALSETYTLTVSGLSESWVTLPATATVETGAWLTLPLTITAPANVEPGAYPFVVNAATGSGGIDQALGELRLVELLSLMLSPAQASVDYGTDITYTLTLSNEENVLREYTLDVNGLDTCAVTLPPTISVPAGEARSVPVVVTAYASLGTHLLTVQAGYTDTNGTVSAQTHAGLTVQGEPGLNLALSPAQGTAGPATPVAYTLLVTNSGTLSDTYTLSMTVPGGWTAQMLAHGVPVEQVSLTPFIFNDVTLQLLVTPPAGTTPGDYPLSVSVTSTRAPALTAEASGIATVTGSGVTLAISPLERNADPRDTLVWNVTVTNSGSVADTFTLTAGGVVIGNAAWSANPVSLAAGGSKTVQLTAQGLDFVTPQTYPLSVEARSQSTSQVFNATTATVTFDRFVALDVSVLPPEQTVSDTTPVRYLAVITNTSNVGAQVALDASSEPTLDILDLEMRSLYLPPHMTAQVLLTAQETQSGTYTLTIQAHDESVVAAGTATLTVIEIMPEPVAPQVSLGEDRSVRAGSAISFSAVISDVDSPTGHSLLWDFGDGSPNVVTDVTALEYTYTATGQYTVTVVVTDTDGLTATDEVLVTVVPADCIAVGEVLTFTGAYTDAGWLDTHTFLWSFGDGASFGNAVTATELTITHTYTAAGDYPVSLTVTDDDGGVGQATITVTVGCTAQWLLPEPSQSVLGRSAGKVLYAIIGNANTAVATAVSPLRAALSR